MNYCVFLFLLISGLHLRLGESAFAPFVCDRRISPVCGFRLKDGRAEYKTFSNECYLESSAGEGWVMYNAISPCAGLAFSVYKDST